MSAERYSSYTESYREFRMNIAENDFHDDYPETAEMTLAICTGLRYHYIYNYRLLTADQTVQLIEIFAKRCAKLEQYKETLNEDLYGPETIIMHTHYFDEMNPAYDEWLLLCHAYGLIALTQHQQQNIIINLANRNRWMSRNAIQLKLLDKDIKRRSELRQKLIDMSKLVNDIDKFNHIYKYIHVPSVNMQTGEQTYKYIIDPYYDGNVNERLGTDTIYEWILNDDVNRFQKWYNDRGLQEYTTAYGNSKKLEYIKNIAAHILASNAVKIIRFILMNNLQEFIDNNGGNWALMDPWKHPVNDPECFRLLQEYFMKYHESIITEFVNGEYDKNYIMVSDVYRYLKPEIVEAIYHEISEISVRLYGSVDIHLLLRVAIEMAKFGHIGPIELLDWDTVMKTLSDETTYTLKNRHVTAKVAHLIRPRYALISEHRDRLPFGMNPSTAVYIHELFSENGLDKIDSVGAGLRKQFLAVFGEDAQKYIIPRI